MTDEPTTPAGAADSGSVWLADIGFAIDRVKRGRRAWREGWRIAAYIDQVDVDGEPVIVYHGRAGDPSAWFPDHADLLATDWRASEFQSSAGGTVAGV